MYRITIMGYTFPYAIEMIAFFACACNYTIHTLRYQFIYQVVSEDLNYTANNSVHYCLPDQTEPEETQQVASKASRWTMYSSLSGNIANSFGAWIIAAKSDQIGRKKAIFFPIVGSLIAAALQLIIIIFRLPLYSLIVSRFISGIFGGHAALIIIGSAHLGDTVKGKDRGKRYAILEAFASGGGAVALIGTGYWVTYSGFIPSSILMVACAFVALLFVPLLSITQNERKKNSFTPCGKNISSSKNYDEEKTLLCNDDKYKKSGFLWLQKCWIMYSKEYCVCESCKGSTETPNHNMQRRLWRLWFYALSYGFYNFALHGSYAFRTMFFASYPVCFTPGLIGAQAGLGNVKIIACPLVIIFLQKCLKLEGQTIIVLGSFARIIYCVMISFATNAPMIFGATCLGLLYNVTTAFLRSEASRLVPNSEQGAALSVLSGLESVAVTFSSIVFLTLYPLSLSISHGFMWIVTAMCFCIPLSMMTVVWFANKLHHAPKTEKTQAALDKK